MARAGAEVVGIDLSRPMLRDLEARLEREPREVRERVSWVHGDMRSVRLSRRFALVVAPFNTVLHLYQRHEIEAFLGRVREHLAPDGRWLFDFSVPQSGDLGRDPTRAYRVPRFRHPTSGQLTRYAERFEYDPVRQLLLVRMEFAPEHGAPSTVPLTHRQFFPQEMEALLYYNGFREITFFGDFTASEPGPGVDSLVVSCRLARKPSAGQRGLARPGRAT
jgi:SAM-dependent methyltransferase